MKSGNTNVTPRLGRIVRYTLNGADARLIFEDRQAVGNSVRRGNDPREGDTYPAMIVRDWAIDHDSAQLASVNLQVFLDGNHTYWATSRSRFDPTVHGKLAVEAWDGNDRPDFIPDPRGHWDDVPVAWLTSDSSTS